MDRSLTAPRRKAIRAWLRGTCRLALFVVVCLIGLATPAGAQYGGVAGISIDPGPNDPYVVTVEGHGCVVGEQIVIYLAGVTPRAGDPVAGIDVPGRVVAVTVAIAHDDPTLGGVFVLEDLELPRDLSPGQYTLVAHCGDIGIEGIFVIAGTPTSPTTTSAPNSLPGTLPLTGASTQRSLAIAATLIGLGLVLTKATRRDTAK